MRIVIVGAGKVGSALCEVLSHEGNSVTLIELKEDRLQSMLEKYEILGVQGNGAFYDVQMEAGVDKADMMIAVAPKDEENIIACVIAMKLGAKHSIARVRTPEHASHMSFMRDSLGITRMINPDLQAAQDPLPFRAVGRALRLRAHQPGRNGSNRRFSAKRPVLGRIAPPVPQPAGVHFGARRRNDDS